MFASLFTLACNSPEQISNGSVDATCQQVLSLVDHTMWTLLDADEDPFYSNVGRIDVPAVCGSAATNFEKFGQEPSVNLDTRFCNWGTLMQASLLDIESGDPIAFRVWHFMQDSIGGATQAYLAIRISDTIVWNDTLPLPATGGLFYETIAAPLDAPAGTPVYWHVHNHGANQYNLIELSVQKTVACAAIANDASD